MCLCVLRFVLKELIQTEKDYVKDLGIVVEVGTMPVVFDYDQSETARGEWRVLMWN